MEIHCKWDELVDPKKLKNHPKNRNKHGQDQVERLAELYKYHGVRHPIIVSKLSHFIVAGHGRKLAAIRAGIDSFPVVYQDFDSVEKEYAFLQADNAIASWAELDIENIKLDVGSFPDLDLSMLGIFDFQVDELKEFLADEDEIPEVVEPKAKLGEIYQLGSHRLMCGDSTDLACVEKLMNGEKAELCFTSPPYSDQREYNGEKDLSVEKISSFISASINSVNYFAVNLGLSRKEGEVYPYWNTYLTQANECGLKLLSWNVWDKGECGSVGNQTAMFGISHEWIFVFGKEKKILNRTVENISAGCLANHNGNRKKDGSVKKTKDIIVGTHSQLKTIYKCVPQKARDEINHPARFPVEFAEGYIEAMTNMNQNVYEPFGGSGSTLIACEKTNRKCYMMELDPHYIDVIIARWEKFTGNKVELLNG